MQGQTNAKIGKKAKLYDTRILETQEAEKGWLYTCSDNYRTFNSSTLPTLYNDINTKFSSNTLTKIEAENFTDIIIPNVFPNIHNIICCKGRYYKTSAAYMDIGEYYDKSDNTWKRVNNDIDFDAFIADEDGEIIIAIDSNSAVYKINPINNDCFKIANTSNFDGGATHYKINSIHNRKQYNNNVYIMQNINYIFCTSTDLNDTNSIEYSFNKRIDDIVFVNGYWYVATYEGIYKGLSLSNNDFDDTSKWEIVFNFSLNNDFIQLFNYGNRFVIFDSYDGSNDISLCYTDDDFNTVSNWYNVINSYNDEDSYYIRFCNGYFIAPYYDEENDLRYYKYCYILDITDTNKWITTKHSIIGQISEPINSLIYFNHDNSIYSLKLDLLCPYNDNYIIDTGKYNTILEKCDINSSYYPDRNDIFFKCYDKYYILYGNNILVYTGNGWQNIINNSPNFMSLVTDSKGTSILACDLDTKLYKINPIDNSIITIANSSIFDTDSCSYETQISYREYNDYFYFYGSKPAHNHVYKTSVNPNINSIVDYSFNKNIISIVYNNLNGYWYLLVDMGNNNNYAVYKGLDLANNNLDDTTKWTVVFNISYVSMYNADIDIINNRFVLYYSKNSKFEYLYSDDEFITTNIVTTNFDEYSEINTLNDAIILIDNNTINYCNISKIDSLNNWQSLNVDYSLGRISNPINNSIYMPTYISTNILNYPIIFNIEKDYKNITINYAKYDNFKICKYVDFTDLNELYNKYGNSEYWNIYNNMISIPVDKQEYKVIYVGDNFTDDLYE